MNNLTLTFAGDESGDVGLRFDHGATRYFVVAIIGTDQPEALRQGLRDLRQQRSLPTRYEFSFHRLTGARLRVAVWNLLQRLDFRVWAIVVDKAKLPDTFYAMPGQSFCVFFVTEVVRLIPEHERRGATLLLDQFDEAGRAITALKRTLKARGIHHGFKRIRAKRSRSEELIQIADLVGGAILRKYSGGDTEGCQVIASKIAALLEYRP